MVKVETIVFLSLILDLFAFTIPLPLFPRLIEWYTVVWLNIPFLLPGIHSRIARKFKPQRIPLFDPPYCILCQRPIV